MGDIIFKKECCIICGILCNDYLCNRHKRVYRYIKEYNFFAIKPYRSISKPQNMLYKHIRDLYGKPTYQECTFSWNIYSRYDIVVPDRNIIVEFDGRQHFVYTALFHKTYDNFVREQEKEKIKQKIAEEAGYKVIRFSYIEKIKDIDYIKKKLKMKK